MRKVRVLRRWAGDAVIVALTVAALVWARGRPVSPLLGYPLALLTTAPLLTRVRYPLAAALIPLSAMAVQSHVDNPSTQTVLALCVVLLACWTLGTVPDRAHALAGIVLAAALLLLVVDGNPEPLALPDVALVALLVSAPFLAATAYQRGLRRAETAEVATDRAIAGERARIARELHDIVGQALSVICLQAGGTRLQLAQDRADPVSALGPLEVIEQAAREAPDEMRRLVELLREGSSPATEPVAGLDSLDSLDELVHRFQEWGLDVNVELRGAPRHLPPGVGLTAFRLLQEALTNALKHGRGAARLTITFSDEGIAIDLVNRARSVHSAGGFGLVGMRERAALYGGTVRTARQGDAFELRAFLPVLTLAPPGPT